MKNQRLIISASLLNSSFHLQSCNYSTVDSNNKKVPIKTYADADVQKLEILKENRVRLVFIFDKIKSVVKSI